MTDAKTESALAAAHWFDKDGVAWMWRSELPNNYVGAKIGNEYVSMLEHHYGANFPVILKGSKVLKNCGLISPHAVSAEEFFWRAIRMSKESLFYEDYGRSKKLNKLIEKINDHIRRRYPRTRFSGDVRLLANKYQFLLLGVKLYGDLKEQKSIRDLGKSVTTMERKGKKLHGLKQQASFGSVCL